MQKVRNNVQEAGEEGVVAEGAWDEKAGATHTNRARFRWGK